MHKHHRFSLPLPCRQWKMNNAFKESEYCLLSLSKSIDFYFAALKVSERNGSGVSDHLRGTGISLSLFLAGKINKNEASNDGIFSVFI